ncbi:oxidoreductase [Microvirga sp. M2]|uniref:oxidoreductase n=1 Tax=Microvirga sp. M2 TaxID=3073270 RepID=UPI0039C0F3E6
MRYIRLLGLLASFLGWNSFACAAEPLPPPTGPVLLTISGRIDQTNAGQEARFDREMLEALGAASITTFSTMSATRQLFEGVSLRSALERVGASGTSIVASAHNSYKITIPVEDLKYEPIIAMRVDGQVLKLRDKGPLWIVYPRDAHPALQTSIYDARWIWQLNKLRVE